MWEQDVSVTDAYERFPELRQLEGREDSDAFGCSALVEITEVKGAKVGVRGSALLAGKSEGYLPVGGRVVGGGEEEGVGSGRCPVLSMVGEGAVGVRKGVVVGYSEYVAKLFENFD